MPTNSPRARLLLLAALAPLASGCFTAGYLAQAAGGELGILHSARSLPRVVEDPQTPERLRELLASVPAIKAFGQSHGLKPTRSYARYADLHRSAAVWVVQACAPLAFDVRRWSFPVVGTTPYLGFFDPRAAAEYAQSLHAREGLDVDVRGASAYSTLGWFTDPVLSTMIPPGEEAQGELADVVLHESVHATLYLKDQSAFDESLASFAADRLTRVWLVASFGEDSPRTRAWLLEQARERAAIERLHRAWTRLDALYRSAAGDEEKLAEKAEILEALRKDLGAARPLNNASLAGYQTYQTGTAAFERLLAACGGSFTRFLAALATLGEKDFRRPQRSEFDDVLDRLAARGCAADERAR